MRTKDYLESIKLQLFGGLLESEIDDKTIKNIINNVALRELNRYYNGTRLKEVPGSSCIDLEPFTDISTVVNVYRVNGMTGSTQDVDSTTDPLLISQLQLYNFNNVRVSSEWVNRYMNYSTVQRVANTMSTDLAFKEDKDAKKLYVNLTQGSPASLTLEYIPLLKDASEVKGEYWTDMLLKLSVAYTKQTLGRIRTRFKQSSSTWEDDGDKILEEATKELDDLREKMRVSNDYMLPVD